MSCQNIKVTSGRRGMTRLFSAVKKRSDSHEKFIDFILTKGCFVSQCLKTFKTLIVDAVLTIVYSFVFCSLELDAKGFPLVDGCGDAELPPKIHKNKG